MGLELSGEDLARGVLVVMICDGFDASGSIHPFGESFGDGQRDGRIPSFLNPLEDLSIERREGCDDGSFEFDEAVDVHFDAEFGVKVGFVADFEGFETRADDG